MSAEAALLEAAAALARQAGRARPLSLTRLAGGKNNQVYRLDCDDNSPLILKRYHVDAGDPRDRLGHEWAFVSHAWGRGVRATPAPLAKDDAHALALFSFAPGVKLAPGEISPDHLDAALDFLLTVNRAPRNIHTLPTASEACFSLRDHLNRIDRRVSWLSTLDPDVPLRIEAEALVSQRLKPIWTSLRARLAARADLETRLPEQAVIASPSDFGFHNMLADGGRLTFIDFEYAGRDDPAKLVSDFFCCPEIPTPIEAHADFAARLMAGLGLDDSHLDRALALFDAYRVKWTCIILNHFLPTGAARRAFADNAADERRCAAQLARASAKLDEVTF